MNMSEEKNGLNPSDENTGERILGEMFAAAKEEDWDAAPGFEERLKTRLLNGIHSASIDTVKLIWKAVPAAAAVTLFAVAALFVSGPFTAVENYIVSNLGDPLVVEDLITLGLF